ncbi:glycerol kinase GlpK [Paenibacillus piri]|nr:glycerol kinase GlpK [Paenibacillus piri]
MKEYLLTIDQSTSGTKALVIDRAGRIVARGSVEHSQYYPSAGWVEHDPMEIYNNVIQSSHAAMKLADISPGQLAAITITNQRETAVMWDRSTGLPVYNAIVWQCQRTAGACEALKASGQEAIVRRKTGLMLDPYFSATKWRWILDHVPNAERLLNERKLLAGTIDSWLLWKLSGGRVHATDYTNASRTSLFNIRTLEWDQELCTLFGVPVDILPEVKSSDECFGYTDDSEWFSERVPVAGVVGDSHAALFGQFCFAPGSAKATYGTGTSVLMNIGEKPVEAGNGLVLAIAWNMSGKVTYALEAVIRTSGDCIKWVRDNLGLFETFQEMDHMLEQAPDNQGVYLVPAFVGLGAPYWEPNARAILSGMNRGTGKAHIVRAAIESIAYQVRDAVGLMEAETGITMVGLQADGGASENSLLMQFQADILERTVVKSEVAELSAMGSAYMGGLGIGFWASLDDVAIGHNSRRIYKPAMKSAECKRYYEGWKKAVATALYEAQAHQSGSGRN